MAHRRVQEGGWSRQVTVEDFPISKDIAGVNMRLTAGGIPPLFLADLRIKIGNFVAQPATQFRQIGTNEYKTGAGIGWHRDKAGFGVVVALSLLAAVSMRFRKRNHKSWIRTSLAPRSVYMLSAKCGSCGNTASPL